MGFQPEASTASPATLGNADVHNGPLDKITAQDHANYVSQLQKIDSMKPTEVPGNLSSVSNTASKLNPARVQNDGTKTNPSEGEGYKGNPVRYAR